jgi:hypothetical protein
MSILRKSSAIGFATSVAVVGLVGGGLAGPASGAKAPASAAKAAKAAKVTATDFGLEAWGFASKVAGGDVPTGSDKTAYSVVACTNKAGVSSANTETDGDLGDGVAFHGAATRAWTSRSGDTVSTWSRHHINQVTVAGSPLGDLRLEDLVSRSHAWHDSSGFHGTSSSSLGAIVLEPAVGEPQTFPVPSPGQSVTVPGVAEITLGVGDTNVTADGADTNVSALRVRTLFSDSNARLAQTHAGIEDGAKTALYRGTAYATSLTAVDDLLTNGRTVSTSVPCVGTDGNWTDNHLSDTDLSGSMLASGLSSRQQSGLTAPGQRPEVTTASRAGLVDLGDGLLVRAVKARAHVMKTATGYRRDIAGTSVGGITFNGEEQEFPEGENVMEIPGVAKIERAIVTRGPRSIEVTGLRVTLLDGTQAVGVLDLAFAKARLVPSGT